MASGYPVEQWRYETLPSSQIFLLDRASLEQGLEEFFFKVQTGKYVWLCRPDRFHCSHSILLLSSKSSHREYINN